MRSTVEIDWVEILISLMNYEHPNRNLHMAAPDQDVGLEFRAITRSEESGKVVVRYARRFEICAKVGQESSPGQVRFGYGLM